jgi:chromate transporter
VGFTLPSALALVAFAYSIDLLGTNAESGWLHGLKVVAVAVVAQAIWGMARSLCPDRPRQTLTLLAAAVALLWPTGLGQVAIIVVAGLVGAHLFRDQPAPPVVQLQVPVNRRLGLACLLTLGTLLATLPLLRQIWPSQGLAVFEGFFRVGSLVFGGGHVVLPLLYAEVVPQGWVSDAQFTAGYGAAQAVPGPLFTFAAYLGASMRGQPIGIWGAPIALVAIFLSSFLLVIGALPFWGILRARADIQAALRAINAAVVGILLAAFYEPVWTSAITVPADFALALAAFGLLVVWKLPPWLVVLFAALGGAALKL